MERSRPNFNPKLEPIHRTTADAAMLKGKVIFKCHVINPLRLGKVF